MSKIPLKDLFVILSWIVLGSLIAWGYQAATSKKAEKATAFTTSVTQRQESVAAAIKAGPQIKSWPTEEGRVTELYVPSKDPSGLFLQIKRCIIWQGRDSASSNMFCDAGADDRGLDPGDGPENTIPYAF